MHLVCLVGIVLATISGCGEDKSVSGKGIDVTAINVEQGNPDSYIQRAKAYMTQGAYDVAITDIQSALSLDSLNADYYHLLADAYLDGLESRKALATMDKVTKMYPSRIPSLLKYAEFQYILKQYDNSVGTINYLLSHDNLNAQGFFMLGMNFHAKGDIERAKMALQTAVENDPDIIDAWILLGELHESSEPELAETYYKNAIQVSQDSPEARHSLAYFYQNSNRIDEAIALYRQIHMDNPDYMAAYMNAGILYMELDSLDKAYEQFDIIVARKVDNPQGYYLRSQVELLRGDFKKALADVNTSLRLYPDNTDADRLKDKILELQKQQ